MSFPVFHPSVLNVAAGKLTHLSKKKSLLLFPSLSYSPPTSNGIPLPFLPSQMSSFDSSSSSAGAVLYSSPLSPPVSANFFSNLGLGYSIAIALGFLVLLSAVVLASYICVRAARNRRRSSELMRQNRVNAAAANGIVLPRIIFVAEDDDDDVESSVVGLGPDVINSYPKFPYCKDRGGGVNDSTCSICLCEYREMEMLRMLPECRHYFHLTCVDAWLKLNASCPVCRNSPLPTPLSTPLSEVVPLSQYAGGRRR